MSTHGTLERKGPLLTSSYDEEEEGDGVEDVSHDAQTYAFKTLSEGVSCAQCSTMYSCRSAFDKMCRDPSWSMCVYAAATEGGRLAPTGTSESASVGVKPTNQLRIKVNLNISQRPPRCRTFLLT